MKEKNILERQCIEQEVEYRKWNECPLWYCVKTFFNPNSGKLESEIVKDEKTKVPIAIKDKDKPQDGVFENAAGTTYYTYHRGYEAALKQVAAASI